MQDDCITMALGLPQLKILWQQEMEGLDAQEKLQGLILGNEQAQG